MVNYILCGVSVLHLKFINQLIVLFICQEMTLEEYEKVLEERKKAFQALKTKERKVDTKEFESMQALSSKKVNHDIFIKLECMLNPKG